MKLNRLGTYEMLWLQLQNLKLTELYYNLLLEKFQKRDRVIKIILLIATSTSIGGWIFWKDPYLKYVWAGIIAVSQLLSTLKPALKFDQYIKELHEKVAILRVINFEYEELWTNYRFEKVGDESAYKSSLEMRKRLSKNLEFNSNLILSDDKHLYDKAKAKLLIYLNSNYYNQAH